jgi:hypothetical protein
MRRAPPDKQLAFHKKPNNQEIDLFRVGPFFPLETRGTPQTRPKPDSRVAPGIRGEELADKSPPRLAGLSRLPVASVTQDRRYWELPAKISDRFERPPCIYHIWTAAKKSKYDKYRGDHDRHTRTPCRWAPWLQFMVGVLVKGWLGSRALGRDKRDGSCLSQPIALRKGASIAVALRIDAALSLAIPPPFGCWRLN